MAIALPRFVSPLDSSGNFVRDAWDRLSGLPGGKRLYSQLINKLVPYTGSIGARVEKLERGHAEMVLDDKRAVRNHLRSVHAIALVNLAEITGNIAVAYALPDDARLIVSKISIEYLKKARGRITATTTAPVPETSERREFIVPVTLTDSSGDVVAKASLVTLVGPKRK